MTDKDIDRTDKDIVKHLVEISQPQKINKNNNNKNFVSTETRLEVIILIEEFRVSCYTVSKIFKLHYATTERIYHIYKTENKIASTPFNKQSLSQIKSEKDCL